MSWKVKIWYANFLGALFVACMHAFMGDWVTLFWAALAYADFEIAEHLRRKELEKEETKDE